MLPITFFVPGVPVPKGSAKAFYRKGMRFPVVVQTNADTQKPWASMIAVYAQQAGVQSCTGPMSIKIYFFFNRPKGHYKLRGDLSPKAPLCHTKKPDCDKLIRCVLDALTEVAWSDDSQVTHISAEKCYVVERHCLCDEKHDSFVSGARITVY